MVFFKPKSNIFASYVTTLGAQAANHTTNNNTKMNTTCILPGRRLDLPPVNHTLPVLEEAGEELHDAINLLVELIPISPLLRCEGDNLKLLPEDVLLFLRLCHPCEGRMGEQCVWVVWCGTGRCGPKGRRKKQHQHSVA
jgi:hypothetical protein